ncbi:hypothetical protein [Occallatibacter savannae]|uniref:hypothetical protein n=1 Tax=Occallatibacter savannae TaxID=1002691 RepID=UPI0013A5A6A7|nr:hypothetical protein [Occallatibacter savannae]
MNDTEIWKSDTDWILKQLGAEITQRRIRRVSFMHEGKVLVAEVGGPNPFNELPVRAIYEDAQRGVFFLCGGTITIAPKDSVVEEY